jgi:hypothetical protein
MEESSDRKWSWNESPGVPTEENNEGSWSGIKSPGLPTEGSSEGKSSGIKSPGLPTEKADSESEYSNESIITCESWNEEFVMFKVLGVSISVFDGERRILAWARSVFELVLKVPTS